LDYKTYYKGHPHHVSKSPLEVVSLRVIEYIGRLSRALTGGMSYPNGFRPTSVAGYGISMEEPVAENPNELMYRESTNIAN
jgi:hypothetical protein